MMLSKFQSAVFGLAAALSLAVGFACDHADAGSLYISTSSIATMEAYGAGSPTIAHAYVKGVGNFDWASGSCSVDNVNTYAATGVSSSVGCWTLNAIVTAASTTAGPGLLVQPGVAPTSPANGSFWIDSGGAWVEVGGNKIALNGPGGSSGQLQVNNGAFGLSGITLIGDCGFSTPTITCTKFNGTAYAGFPQLALGNIFTSAQTTDLGTGALPSALTGTVDRIANANSTMSRFEADSWGAASVFSGFRADGTRASPTAVTTTELLAAYNGHGQYDTTAGHTGVFGSIHIYADGAPSSSSFPGEICIATTAVSATTPSDQLCQWPDGGITLGSPASGDLGAGTVNVAGSVNVNGVVLTPATGSSPNPGQPHASLSPWYTTPISSTPANVAVTANQIYFVPFYSAGVGYQVASFYVATGSAGKFCELGVYSNVNGTPTSLLTDLGQVSAATSSAAAAISATISAMSTPGWYFYAFACNAAVTVTSVSSTDPYEATFIQGTAQVPTGTTIVSRGWFLAWTFLTGNLPSSASGATTQNQNNPLVWFEKS